MLSAKHFCGKKLAAVDFSKETEKIAAIYICKIKKIDLCKRNKKNYQQ